MFRPTCGNTLCSKQVGGSQLSALKYEPKSVPSACPSSSVSSTDALGVEPTAQKKNGLRPEVENLSTKKEEIIALG
jgi:hypothetical protein